MLLRPPCIAALLATTALAGCSSPVDSETDQAAAAESSPSRPNTALFADGVALSLVAPCWYVTPTTIEVTNLGFWKHFPMQKVVDATHPILGSFRITSGHITPDAIHVDGVEDASGRTVEVDVVYVPDPPSVSWYLQTGFVGTITLAAPGEPEQVISIARSEPAL